MWSGLEGAPVLFSMYSRLYIDFTADLQSRSSRHSHSPRHRDEKHSAVCVSAQLVQRTCILASTFSFRQICSTPSYVPNDRARDCREFINFISAILL